MPRPLPERFGALDLPAALVKSTKFLSPKPAALLLCLTHVCSPLQNVRHLKHSSKSRSDRILCGRELLNPVPGFPDPPPLLPTGAQESAMPSRKFLFFKN